MKLAFASDFDNTLYFPDGIHQQDIDAIHAFQKEGNLFGVCTGRSLTGVMIPIKNRIDFDFYILATGSYILNKNKKPIYSNPIPKDIVQKITDTYENQYKIAYNSGADFYCLQGDYEMMTTINKIDDIKEDIHGISFLTESAVDADQICKEINSRYPVSAFHNKQFVDITGLGSSKGNAIQILKKHYGIDKMAGMGDSFNDITLLEAVDTAFTFTTSPDILKSKVSHITDSVAESLNILLKK